MLWHRIALESNEKDPIELARLKDAARNEFERYPITNSYFEAKQSNIASKKLLAKMRLEAVSERTNTHVANVGCLSFLGFRT